MNRTICMFALALLLVTFAAAGARAEKPAEKMTPLELGQVSAGGEFGRRLQQLSDNNYLKVDAEKLFVRNFRVRAPGGHGYLGFGKFLDGLVRLAKASGDARLVALKKQLIGELLATQGPDGYIGTVKDPKRRIIALWDLHEDSYLIWAMVSDEELFGETASLNAACRMADGIIKAMTADPKLKPDTMNGVVTFEGSSLGCDRAMLALTRRTGDPKYRSFALTRLHLPEFNPVIKTGPTSLANHAYTYLAHSLAQLDLYRETGDSQLLRATRRAVDFLRRGDGMLVTGSCSESECWHDTQSGLQNTAETCTGAYLVRLMDALLRLEGDSLYGDIMERAIYNAMFAAVSPDGRNVRYFTPFEGPRAYSPHGDTFCCANNFRRIMGDLTGYMVYRTSDGAAVNLYSDSVATLELGNGVKLRLVQTTAYPTSGTVTLKVEPSRAAEFSLRLRIPRWCAAAEVAVNGGAAEMVAGGQFHALRRTWTAGDVVTLKMPLAWRMVRGRKAQSGRVAILRGPVLYTMNRARNSAMAKHPEFDPKQLMIDPATAVVATADDSVRPGGVAGIVKSWQPGAHNFWPFRPRVDLVLSEFADAGGEACYFIVPDPVAPAIMDDELIESPRPGQP